MAIIDLFSKKQKRLHGEVPLITFDNIPQPLRFQIVFIIQSVYNLKQYDPATYQYELIQSYYLNLFNDFRTELGVINILEYRMPTVESAIYEYLLKEKDVIKVFDLIQLAFQRMFVLVPEHLKDLKNLFVGVTPENAVVELNKRFKEHGIGYHFESNELIRVDSTYIHSELVKPTLELLRNKKFLGANEEYMNAHNYYKHGNNKACLVECGKAFESTMKIICIEKRWTFNAKKDAASKLISIMLDKELIPKTQQTHFSHFLSLLESGVPSIRNGLGGHGQGQSPIVVSDEITRYCLNLTGANIIFLIEQSGI